MNKKNLTNQEIQEIEDLYDSSEYRLSQARNDFLLPQILDFVNGVMVALDRLYEQHKQSLIDSSKDIRQTIKERFKDEEFHALIVGRSNTAPALKKKIQEIEDIFKKYT